MTEKMCTENSMKNSIEDRMYNNLKLNNFLDKKPENFENRGNPQNPQNCFNPSKKKFLKNSNTLSHSKLKKFRSAYIIYSLERRPVLKKLNAKLTNQEATKIIAAEWREMEHIKKQHYYDLEEQAREVFLKSKEENSATGTAYKYKMNPKSRMPKRFRTPYMFFIQSHKEKLRSESKLENIEMMRKLTLIWKDMSKEEKLKFEKMTEEDKKRFDREVEQYMLNSMGSRKRVSKKKEKIEKFLTKVLGIKTARDEFDDNFSISSRSISNTNNDKSDKDKGIFEKYKDKIKDFLKISKKKKKNTFKNFLNQDLVFKVEKTKKVKSQSQSQFPQEMNYRDNSSGINPINMINMINTNQSQANNLPLNNNEIVLNPYTYNFPQNTYTNSNSNLFHHLEENESTGNYFKVHKDETGIENNGIEKDDISVGEIAPAVDNNYTQDNLNQNNKFDSKINKENSKNPGQSNTLMTSNINTNITNFSNNNFNILANIRTVQQKQVTIKQILRKTK